MPQDKVEFRQQLDFGQLISYFFEFVKSNWKNFSDIFLRHNGWFILIFVGLSYLMVSGYFGIIVRFGSYNEPQNANNFAAMAGFGMLFYVIMLLVVGGLNYGLSSAYMTLYINRESDKPIESKAVWQLLKSKGTNLAVFMLLLVLLLIGWLILFILANFIPLLGFLFGYALFFMLMAWAGVSCMAMFHDDLNVTEAMVVGWNLIVTSFWKCVGINFVISLIIGMLRIFILSIPMIIAGVIFYHVVDQQSMRLTDSLVTISWTFFVAIATVVTIYAQALSQFMNAGLYLSLKEAKTNTYLRTKINQIGLED